MELGIQDTVMTTAEAIGDAVEAAELSEDEEEPAEVLTEKAQEEADVPSQITEQKGFALGALLGSLSINLFLPFINGLMLGFGEIIAHEIGFHYNWFGANVSMTFLCPKRFTNAGRYIVPDRVKESIGKPSFCETRLHDDDTHTMSARNGA